jgi:hypothetical protein
LLSTIRTHPLYIIPCSVELTIRWREDSTKLIKCCIFLHQLNVEGDEDLEEQGTVSAIILVKTNFLWFLFNGFRYNCFCYATLVCPFLGKLVLTKEWPVDRYSTSEVKYEGRCKRASPCLKYRVRIKLSFLSTLFRTRKSSLSFAYFCFMSLDELEEELNTHVPLLPTFASCP